MGPWGSDWRLGRQSQSVATFEGEGANTPLLRHPVRRWQRGIGHLEACHRSQECHLPEPSLRCWLPAAACRTHCMELVRHAVRQYLLQHRLWHRRLVFGLRRMSVVIFVRTVTTCLAPRGSELLDIPQLVRGKFWPGSRPRHVTPVLQTQVTRGLLQPCPLPRAHQRPRDCCRLVHCPERENVRIQATTAHNQHHGHDRHNHSRRDVHHRHIQ